MPRKKFKRVILMWIRKKEIEKLSALVKKLIAGENVDVRDNREGPLNIFKNDIHTLAMNNREQVANLQRERDILKDTLADISHQLKTPITSMMIMSELLIEAPADKQAEFINNIQSSLGRTEWLVSALLKMAKLEAKSIEFKKEIISSKDLVNLALTPLRISLELREQEVVITGAEDFGCDAKWTAEALSNIIKNASEHSPNGSTITISIGSNPITKWISVVDSGDGLSRNQIANVFKRFENSTSSEGYGIGLPLALTIMRSQRGDIEVDGGRNRQGATFTLKFYRK